MDFVETPPSQKPPVSAVANSTTKKTKMDKLKTLNPISLKKSPKQEKRPSDATNDGEGSYIPLPDALEDARKAMDLFLNNEFVASRNIVEPL